MTTDVLILGWSDIVRRRVIPALTQMPEVRVSIATTSDVNPVEPLIHRTWSGATAIERAIDDTSWAVVYVSGVNTVHARRVEAALLAGHHVIVDKPGFLSATEAERCIAIAMERRLLVAEATVWSWHTQVAELMRLLATLGRPARRIRSTFVIPPLPTTNFRTDATRGGGAVADMGAYAMSPGQVFGGGDLDDCTAEITEWAPSGLDIAFRVSARYRSGLSVGGTFSMNGDYQNRLEVEGEGFTATLSPAFSSRPDDPLPVNVTIDGIDMGFTAPACDPFARFLSSALTDGVADPGSWTAVTRVAAADLARLTSACGLSWA